jgi:hypothetical protein
MKRMTLLPVLLLTIAASGALLVVAQQDEDTRGAFMTTRPKPSEARKPTPKPTHRRPKPTPSPSSSPKPGSVDGTTAGTTRKGQRLGLGLTLFMRDSTGLAVRTDPSREFHKGDHVRVLLETNADGFLYVFNTTDDGPAVMIYPDPELEEAGNYIQAHVPFEIPSSTAPEERLRWFTFDQKAGGEKLYFVFSREPLSGVPIEDDLVSFCRNDSSKCPWRPSAETWTAMQKEMSSTIKSDRQGRMEGGETPAEHRGVTRGIGLNRDDPEPTLIMLSAATSKNVLIAQLDMVHK